jgi:hypothetical protein
MLSYFDFHDPNKRDAFYNWMEALSVGWLVAPGFADTNRVECFAGYAGYDVQRIKNVLPRARFAERVMLVPTPEELYKRSLNGSFDPRREAVLQTEADMKRVAAAQTGVSDGRETARIVADRATEVVVDASSSAADCSCCRTPIIRGGPPRWTVAKFRSSRLTSPTAVSRCLRARTEWFSRIARRRCGGA